MRTVHFVQEEGWDFEEDIANEDYEGEVNKEEQRAAREQEEADLAEEKVELDRELKKVRLAAAIIHCVYQLCTACGRACC